MVDYARANPGKINYGTAGVGLVHHLVMEKLCFDEKIKMVNVPYKGGGELMISVLGGEVEAAAAAPDFVPHVKSGKARLLATYFPTRLPIFPESPTFLEQGYNIAVRNTTAIVGPKGLPRPIVEKLDHAFKKALDDPNFLASMKSFELGVRYQGPEELAKYIAEFIDTYGPIARKIGMKLF
jgi:tripartite-type tricarboxylate transporter receptor subunit TctC